MQWIETSTLTKWIQSLDDDRFVDLANALLSETAARNDIDRSCIATNLRVKEPDGGIDARCDGAPKSVGRLIPRPATVYQFKSGQQKKSARKIVDDDILAKPRVVDRLRRGYAFVYLASWDRGHEVEDDLIRLLREKVDQCQGEEDYAELVIDDGQIVFIGVDTITRLLSAFPGLVARFLRLDIEVDSLEEWAAFRSLSNPYQVDAELQARLQQLREQIAVPGSRTRLVGAAGNGKTRLALEALRGSELTDTVIYARQPKDLHASFVSYLRRTPDVCCTAVVDEVNDAEAAELEDRFSDMPQHVRLVTIGLDASRHQRPETFEVEGLSEELLVATITGIATGLPLEVARSVARDCEHSPKLAVLVATRLREKPELVAPSQRLGDGAVWKALDQYLDLTPNSPEWHALSIASLLTRIGWRDDVEGESEMLFRAVDLDPTAARRHIDNLHERFGIAPLAGRYRYVSPAILADYLAAKQLNDWTRTRVIEVFDTMTRAMTDSFAQRLRRMAGVLDNRRVIEEVVLGDHGPFRTLADLEDDRIGTILRRFAAPFPRATLAALRRIIAPTSLDELRAATRSRRDLVWTLEELLWREDTFEGAADLLLRLAVAENETWSNNASGMWVSTFQMMLGRTAAGSNPRAHVLRRASKSAEPKARQVVAQAIAAGIHIGHMWREGRPPDELEGGPVEDWRPATFGEWADTIVTYLGILAPMFIDSDTDVRQAAAGALAEGVDAALELPPQVLEAWMSTARTLVSAEYAVRAPVLEAIDRVRLRHDRPRVNTDTDSEADDGDEGESLGSKRGRLVALAEVADELRGKDFSSRFRAALTRSLALRIQMDQTASEEARRELEGLAVEVLESPVLLATEVDWLLDRDPWGGVQWFSILGGLDRNRMLEPVLRAMAGRSPAATMWASLYDLAYAEAIEDPSFIDRRVAKLRSAGAPGDQVLDLLMRAGYSADRLADVIELLESQAVPAAAINQLAYRPWGPEMPPAAAQQLAAAAASRADELSDVLPFVATYLSQVEGVASQFRDIALRLLAAIPTEQTPSGGMDPWRWTELAKLFVDEDPELVADAALAQVATRGSGWGHEVRPVLERAWASGDKRRLFEDVIAPWIEARGGGGWKVRYELSGFPVGDVGIDALTQWVAVEPERRAPMLAEVIGPPGDQLSDVHAALLERYRDQGAAVTFYNTLITGAFSGSEAVWLGEKLERARRWVDDDRPSVREWAQEVVRALEASVHAAEAREVEERFEW